jgi:hypothetical protein
MQHQLPAMGRRAAYGEASNSFSCDIRCSSRHFTHRHAAAERGVSLAFTMTTYSSWLVHFGQWSMFFIFSLLYHLVDDQPQPQPV